MYCIVCTVLRTECNELYGAVCTVCTVLYVLSCMYCTLYVLYSVLYVMYCMYLCTVLYVLYTICTVLRTVCTVLYVLYVLCCMYAVVCGIICLVSSFTKRFHEPGFWAELCSFSPSHFSLALYSIFASFKGTVSRDKFSNRDCGGSG